MNVSLINREKERWNQFEKHLSKEELTQFECLNVRKAEWLSGKIATKKALADYLGKILEYKSITISKGKNGNPLIKEYPDLFCSISHSENFTSAVVFDSPIGTDIEKIRWHDSNLWRKILNPEERNLFPEINNETMTKVWTIKESVAKGEKVGMGLNFKKIIIKKIISSKIFKVEASLKSRLTKWQVENHKINSFYLSNASLIQI